jgi:hypothetical protein
LHFLYKTELHFESFMFFTLRQMPTGAVAEFSFSLDIEVMLFTRNPH